MPMMPSRLFEMRWPSIQVGDQPFHSSPPVSTAEPSTSRRGTARISAMVMSAVSSVSTPGVLVTVMPRASAVATSILSTPLPKLAMSLRFAPACDSTAESMRSVTVGTSTSADLTASTSSACESGRSSTFSRASNSSRMRVSTLSGKRLVTMTRGFFFGIPRLASPIPSEVRFLSRPPSEPAFTRVRTFQGPKADKSDSGASLCSRRFFETQKDGTAASGARAGT